LLMEKYLNGEEPSVEEIKKAVRQSTVENKFVPVLGGSSFKNKGVQNLLDAVIQYLPNPEDISNTALDLENEEQEVLLTSNPEAPAVALAFKLEDGRYGQLTYIRVYQGNIAKGDTLHNTRNNKKIKVGRLVRMDANNMEDIEKASTGEIIALFGVDCASGDTFTSGNLHYSMSSIHVPDPVISLTVTPVDNKSQVNMSKALNRFIKEDPTFKSYVDSESGETVISGMGELHLDVYIERMKREYSAEVETGMPQVAYRETISRKAEFNYTHRKQTGGSGQYGRVAGFMEPYTEGEYNFVDKIKGGSIPSEFISSCDKGFHQCLGKGSLIGFPITNIQTTINDGNSHSVDSSDVAFQQAARGAFLEAYAKAKPIILEPIMKVVVEGPSEFQGAILATLNQRRGMISGVTEDGAFSVIEAEVPLSEMFGYSTVLRSATQGKAEFTMEFARYKPVPQGIAEELKKEYSEEKKSA